MNTLEICDLILTAYNKKLEEDAAGSAEFDVLHELKIAYRVMCGLKDYSSIHDDILKAVMLPESMAEDGT